MEGRGNTPSASPRATEYAAQGWEEAGWGRDHRQRTFRGLEEI